MFQVVSLPFIPLLEPVYNFCKLCFNIPRCVVSGTYPLSYHQLLGLLLILALPTLDLLTNATIQLLNCPYLPYCLRWTSPFRHLSPFATSMAAMIVHGDTLCGPSHLKHYPERSYLRCSCAALGTMTAPLP